MAPPQPFFCDLWLMLTWCLNRSVRRWGGGCESRDTLMPSWAEDIKFIRRRGITFLVLSHNLPSSSSPLFLALHLAVSQHSTSFYPRLPSDFVFLARPEGERVKVWFDEKLFFYLFCKPAALWVSHIGQTCIAFWRDSVFLAACIFMDVTSCCYLRHLKPFFHYWPWSFRVVCTCSVACFFFRMNLAYWNLLHK